MEGSSVQIFGLLLVLLGILQRDYLCLLRLLAVIFARNRPHHEQFLWIMAALVASFSLHFDLLSVTIVVLGLPWILDYSSHRTVAGGAGLIVICSLFEASSSEMVVVLGSLGVAVYVCNLRARRSEAQARVEKAAKEIAALKSEEEGLKAQVKFRKFQANPLTSQQARRLIAKLQEAAKPKLGSSGDIKVDSLKDEEEESRVVHSKTEVAILQVDVEEDRPLESVSSLNELSKSDLSNDDLE